MLFPNPTLSNCSPVHLGLYPNQLYPLQTLSIREFVQTLFPKKKTNSVQLYPCPPGTLSKPTLPKLNFRIPLCPNVPLSISGSIQTCILCPSENLSEYNYVQPYPCPSRALSKPPSSVHHRICPNVIPKSNSVQLCPCPPGTLFKPTLPTVDSVHQRICP